MGKRAKYGPVGGGMPPVSCGVERRKPGADEPETRPAMTLNRLISQSARWHGWLCLACLVLGLVAREARGQNAPPNDDWFTPTMVTNVFGDSIFDDNLNATKIGGGFFSRTAALD